MLTSWAEQSHTRDFLKDFLFISPFQLRVLSLTHSFSYPSVNIEIFFQIWDEKIKLKINVDPRKKTKLTFFNDCNYPLPPPKKNNNYFFTQQNLAYIFLPKQFVTQFFWLPNKFTHKMFRQKTCWPILTQRDF